MPDGLETVNPADLKAGFVRLMRKLRGLSAYAARAEKERLLRAITNPQRLEHFGCKVYSQNDEDGILQEILRRMDVAGPSSKFVEIGVEDGLENNTLFLLHSGFSGAWLEKDEKAVESIRRRFAAPVASDRLRVAQAFVTAENVNDHVLSAIDGWRDDIAVLSIDIDGNDYWIWKALTCIAPPVVVVEYNAKFPPPVALVQDYGPDHVWGGTDYFGASLAALTGLAESKGYRLVACNITGINAFFVKAELIGDRFPFELTAQHLYQPCRYHLTDDGFYKVGHRSDFGAYVTGDGA